MNKCVKNVKINYRINFTQEVFATVATGGVVHFVAVSARVSARVSTRVFAAMTTGVSDGQGNEENENADAKELIENQNIISY